MVTAVETDAFLKSDEKKTILCDIEYHTGTSLELATFSDSPYISENNIAYDDVLISTPNITSRLETSDTIGRIEILNSTGEYDSLINSAWEGHSIKLYIGKDTWDKDDFVLIYEGTCTNMTAPNAHTLALGIRDKNENLDIQVQSNLITHDYLDALYAVNPEGLDAYIINISEAAGIHTFQLRTEARQIKNTKRGGDIIWVTKAVPYDNRIALPVTKGIWTYDFVIDEANLTDLQITEVNTYIGGGVGIGTRLKYVYGKNTKFIELLDNTLSYNTAGVEINIASDATLAEVTAITLAELQKVAGITASETAGTIEVINILFGDTPNAADAVNAEQQTGFTFNTTIPGAPGTAEVFTIIPTADTAGSLNSKYFTFSTPALHYYVWYNVDNLGVDPEYNFFVGIPFNPVFHQIPDTVINTQVPICLGKVFNIKPKLIDASNHVYMLHEGPITEVTEVRSDGIALDPSQYEAYEDGGCFRILVHSKNKEITCDAIGAASRPVGHDPALILTPYTAPWLVEWLALTKSNLTSADICGQTFPNITPNGFTNLTELGVYIDSEAKVGDIINNIMSSVGAFARFGRLFSNVDSSSVRMQIQLVELEDPALKAQRLISAGETIVEVGKDQIQENGITLINTEPPKSIINLGYNRNWYPQDKDSLVGLLTDVTSDKLYLSEIYSREYTRASGTINNVLDVYPLAEDTDLIETYIRDEIGNIANQELTKRMRLRNKKRFLFKIDAVISLVSISIGNIIKVTSDRFGFNNGRYCFVVGVVGNPVTKKTTLEVWL